MADLQLTLDSLSARVDAFSRALDSTIRSERIFRLSLDTVSRSLHAFAASHAREDAHLARMVAADTQRSRDAKDEYDALAARFEESLTPHAATRRLQWLRRVGFYAGVLLSVVFMAPLHLLVRVFEKVLFRLGYARRPQHAHAYVRGAPRMRRQRRRSRPGRVSFEMESPDSVPTSLRSTLGSESLHSGPESVVDAGEDAQAQAQAQARRTVPPDAAPKQETRSGGDAGGTARRMRAESRGEVDGVRGRGAEDDAGAAEGSAGREPETERGEQEEEWLSMDGSRNSSTQSHRDSYSSSGMPRPDWASPFDDEPLTADLGSFPSAEFWKISDEDIRIERLKAQEDSLPATS